MRTFLSITLIALMLAGCTSSPSTATLPPAGASPDIFKTYRKNGPSDLNLGWTRGFDMSGVAFDNHKTCTLITPMHVVMAKHYKRPLHSKITFHDQKGKRQDRFIRRIQNAAGDVAVAVLDRPLPSNFKPYPLPSPQTNTSLLINRPIAITEQNRGIYFHQVASFTGVNLRMKFTPNQPYGQKKSLIKGDSGNPSFFIHQGQLVLAETHHFGGAGSGPYFGNPEIQASVINAVRDLNPAYRIQTVTLTP